MAPEYTFGEKAVGIDFDPGGDADVVTLKEHYAQVIDHLNTIRETTEDSETKRLCSVAITEAQTAQMWAVKAVTWTS